MAEVKREGLNRESIYLAPLEDVVRAEEVQQAEHTTQVVNTPHQVDPRRVESKQALVSSTG